MKQIRVLRVLVSAALLVWISMLSGYAQEVTARTVESMVKPMVNMLGDHPSPYLALHGDDPVQWQDWSQGVLDRAQAEGKLIYVSIGYFSCHWCHVMQKESFKAESAANKLNAGFIPVKVDRELNPALDAQLMEFTQQLLGRGGWPLNIYLTPDGHPLYAHLYTPRENFESILNQLSTVWIEQEDELRKVAKRESQRSLPAPEADFDLTSIPSLLDSFGVASQGMMDDMVGGFGDGPKFPSAPALAALLELQAQQPDASRAEFLTLTFDSMATEGLRDHLDGGFFRYTVDPQWQTPHYEKMLYTNAMLVPLYIRAAHVLDMPHYQSVARDTLDFMLRRMLGDNGAFIAAFSAVDDAGIEGGNYLWTIDAVRSLLTDDEYNVANMAYGFSEDAAGKDLLPRIRIAPEDIAQRTNFAPEKVARLFSSARAKLINARQKRPLPVDDKYLAGWNGLALRAFVQGALAFDEPRYAQASDQLAAYLGEQLWVDGQLLRAVDDTGQPIGQSSIQDYALVSDGLADYLTMLHDKQIDDSRLTSAREFAVQLIDVAWTSFFKNNGWQQLESDLIPGDGPRPILLDTALPSSSSTLIKATLALGAQLEKPTWRKLAVQALNQGMAFSKEFPFWTATQRLALMRMR